MANNPYWLQPIPPAGDRLAGMEFSYTVSEAEYRQAWRVERKASSRSSLKTALFWILVMAGLMVIYIIAQPGDSQAGASDRPTVRQTSTTEPTGRVTAFTESMEEAGPFLVLAGVWILIVTGLVPLRLRYLYRKDPRMRGQFTVDITRDSISTDNTVGTSSKSAWNIYDYWCEGKGVIVLMFHSGAYSVLSLAGLSDPQRDELRGILCAVLPKR
jgi:hypothetical protein